VGEDIQSLARTCASWGRSALETEALIRESPSSVLMTFLLNMWLVATPFTTLCQAHASLHGTGVRPVSSATPSFGSSNNNDDDEENGDRVTITYFATPTQQPSQETPATTSGASPTSLANPGIIATAAVLFLAMMQM
jgi:hypothetical protein